MIEVDGERGGHDAVRGRQPALVDRLPSAASPSIRASAAGRVGDEAARLFQRHLLVELGLHRLQLEIYGFNERAIAHAERIGFVREGVKRKAYRRGDGWVDGVLYALLQRGS